MISQPYITSWSKRSLSKCAVVNHILREWQLVRHLFEWVWVILGGWDIILCEWGRAGMYGPYFGLARVSGSYWALLWVSCDGWALFWVEGGRWM